MNSVFGSKAHTSTLIRSDNLLHISCTDPNSHSARKIFVTRIYALTGKDIAETKKYSRHKSLANLDYYIGTTQDLSLVNQLHWT